MQFNQPEVLYALFLLIIPILIHLFRLRRFKKEDFTNVKFLKKLSEQTRKSSQLKKWLVLLTRLLILACIILAFSQPYFPNNEEPEEAKTFIYLDNSYSMQANGKQGALLESSKQQLLKFLPENKNITLFTNTEIFENVTRNDIQNIDYPPSQLDLNTLLLKINSTTSNIQKRNNLLLISDRRDWDITKQSDSSSINLYYLDLKPKTSSNISIDTAFISSLKPDTAILNVKLNGETNASTSVSIYNNEQLLGKTGVTFENKKDTTIQFQLQNTSIAKGVIRIEDNGLSFDNSLYFNINEVSPINVTSINSSEDQFLKKIYTKPQFNYTSLTTKSVDYNSLENAQVIILNELSEISNSLQNNLIKKAKEKTLLIIIPSPEISEANIKLLFKQLELPEFTSIKTQEKLITNIAFGNPVFRDAFEKKISNFEYPSVQTYYDLNRNFGTTLLSYEDQQPFLFQRNNKYVFTAPINQSNSNFLQSPLVVLSFYNIGLSALKPSQLYYTLGESNFIDIPIKTIRDEILEIKSTSINFIPQQQQLSDLVKIKTDELPEQAGNYEVWLKGENIYTLSYNINRSESRTINTSLELNSKIQKLESLPEFIKLSGFTHEVDSFWKWFVTFALFFLIIETLLLKYFK